MMRFGLIGHPLAGSGSPALFREAYQDRWPYDLIEGADFEKSWRTFLSDYQAINITAPFKEAAYARLLEDGGSAGPECESIGAINIAVKTADGIVGRNSDFLGVRQILQQEGFGQGQVALVAGYGGAGKAAAAAAQSIGMDAVVCNRSPRQLPGGQMTRPLAELPILAAVTDILIYTLPAAIPEISFLLQDEGPAAVPVVLEANYRTPCLAETPAKYIPGSRWLLEQARCGYSLMTSQTPKL